MAGRALLLASLLAFVVAAAPAQDRPGEKDLAWGPAAGAYRMAVWTKPSTATAFVAVRNSSSRRICYCAPPYDLLPDVYLRTGPTSEWRKIGFRTAPEPVTFVAVCNTVSLRPEEEMPSYSRETRGRKNDHSLAVDLRLYDLPGDLSGTVELKFALHLDYAHGTQCAKPRKDVVVESKPFAVKLPLAGG